MSLPRHAVQAALAAAEAAGLREVADVIVTLARQLEEERARADAFEDSLRDLRGWSPKERLWGCEIPGHAHPTRKEASACVLQHWAEEDAKLPANPTPIERHGAASVEGPCRMPPPP